MVGWTDQNGSSFRGGMAVLSTRGTSPTDLNGDPGLLWCLDGPGDLRAMGPDDLARLAAEIRCFLVEAVARTGGHLGSNLGVVELTLSLHRTFRSPEDLVLWDTGHLAYPHKLVTGRRDRFTTLRQAGGLSGYPSRRESAHDWVENSHASTVLSYADGLASAFALRGEDRRVAAVLGDGALTGGLAYEALNNLGFYGRRVTVVLNDNGRSYAPTVSRLTVGERAGDERAGNERAGNERAGNERAGNERVPGAAGARGFFEALGLAYRGPVDGHDVAALDAALDTAAAADGPTVVHVVTEKGRGYRPATTHAETRLHDTGPFPDVALGPRPGAPVGYTAAFAEALVAAGRRSPEVVALTAAMPGSTGLLPFQAAFPDRFVDVGMAEQHAVTKAAGLAMGGMRPVVAVYSTFFTRAFDQANLDVGLHGQRVVLALDRAGVTGDDGPSHNGVLDLALCLKVPGLTVFAPSSAREVATMLDTALELDGPAAIRFPKGPSPDAGAHEVGRGLRARCVRRGSGEVCVLAVGRMLDAAERAARLLEDRGLEATVWDVRVVAPLDPDMVADAARHELVVTVEDGIAVGGAGSALTAAIATRAATPTRGAARGAAAAGTTHPPGGAPPPRVLTLGTPLRFLDQGRAADILAGLGLDGPGIAGTIGRARGLEGPWGP
jgi:1-deoxy-D-xylulose-5-phosphate synthase